MLRGSTDLKGNFHGSMKELQLRKICVLAEHRRPLGSMYRVRHPLTEIRHVSWERWVPVWFLSSRYQRWCCRKLCTCLWMCFLNSLLILFLLHVRCSFASETVPLLQQPLISIALPFYLFFHWSPPSLLHLCTSSLLAPFSHPDNWNISKLLWDFLPSPLSLFQFGGFVQCWNPLKCRFK